MEPEVTARASSDGPPADAGGGDGAGRRHWLSIATTVAVLAIVAVVAALTVDLDAVLGAVRRADVGLVAAAAAVYATSWPLRGRRYRDVLAPMGHRLGTGFLTLATFASQTANLVVPARAGDAARAYLLRDRRGVPYPTGAASLTVERAFDLLAIGVLGGLALGWLVVTGDAGPALGRVDSLLGAARETWTWSVVADAGPAGSVGPVATTVVVVAVAGVVLASAVVVAAPLVRRGGAAALVAVGSHLPDRLHGSGVAFARDLAGFTRRPRSLALVGAGSLAVWTLDALTAILVLAAVAEPGIGGLLAAGTLAVCAGNLAKVLPLTQGGLGLYEGAFAATIVAVAPVAGAGALAAAVLDHGVKNAVTVAGGAISWVGLSTASIPGGEQAPRDGSQQADRTDSVLGRPKK